MNIIYIYALKNPITDEVRYVGKTSNIRKRYTQHISDKRQTHKRSWIDSLLKEDLKPIIEILEVCDSITWEEREIYWMMQYDNLTNHKPGGNGNSSYINITKEETRRKLSESRKKVILTDEWKDNIGRKLGTGCIVDGIEYRSIKQASIDKGINHDTVKRRIENPLFPNYIYSQNL